jgi:hypothetical protein
LLFAVAALAVLDRFEPALLRSLEEARYEDPAKDFRFENSDLFGLGPLVAYLREHPRGEHARVMFLGNSVIWGYELATSDALPAQYQRLDRSAKVFNVGLNGFRMGSLFLAAKAAVEGVDLMYVLRVPREEPYVHAILPRLIPVDDGDLARFHLTRPDETERLLSLSVNHWRLYRDSYRLQAAIFGSSTRQFLYLHKGALVRSLMARVRAERASDVASDETVTIEVPVSAAMPDAARQTSLRAQSPDLWEFGDLFLSRRRQGVLLQIPGHSVELTNAAIADFNRVFAPYARVLVLHIPPTLMSDGTHLTSAGAARVARALWDARPQDSLR